MFFLWSIFIYLFVIINCDQLCIDRCQFEYDLYTNFSLPSDCNITRRDHCFVITTFDYSKKIIKIYFNLEFDEDNIIDTYQTDNTIRTIINLAEPSFIQHSIEYFCSTADYCDLHYVENIAIPKYTSKICDDFRSQLIQYLNPYPPSFERDCYLNETTLKCDQPCEFTYNNPNQISRSCKGTLNMMFQTIVGQSTPINKEEYNFRIWNYACITPLCNGKPMQERIENLIHLDNEKCLIILNQPNETTTQHIPSKSLSIFRKSDYLIIFIIGFLSLTFVFIQLNTH